MTHRKVDAERAKRLIKIHVGNVQVEIVGSIAKEGRSEHDIDLVVDLRGFFASMFDIPLAQVERTDWGGYYLRGTEFGDVDLFFSPPEAILKLRAEADA